ARLLPVARRSHSIVARGAASFRARGAGGPLFRHAARLAVVAPARVRGRPLRLPTRERAGARVGPGEALPRQCQHADTGPHLHRLLLLPSPGHRAHRPPHGHVALGISPWPTWIRLAILV